MGTLERRCPSAVWGHLGREGVQEGARHCTPCLLWRCALLPFCYPTRRHEILAGITTGPCIWVMPMVREAANILFAVQRGRNSPAPWRKVLTRLSCLYSGQGHQKIHLVKDDCWRVAHPNGARAGFYSHRERARVTNQTENSTATSSIANAAMPRRPQYRSVP